MTVKGADRARRAGPLVPPQGLGVAGGRLGRGRVWPGAGGGEGRRRGSEGRLRYRPRGADGEGGKVAREHLLPHTGGPDLGRLQGGPG